MKHKLSKITLAVVSATTLNFSPLLHAEEAGVDKETEVIEVTGIRSALTSALAEKRETINLVEVIEAVDIGKLPDQNLAEVLENITGVQITRTAGVGTGVQIRGTDSNRVEFNGVSTVGSGAGRSGINFEDVSAGIIAGIEVTKSPSAKTIEGSVGGTVNLRTIRPLQLESTLASIRLQGEDSSLSEDSITPRVSATYGDNWDLSSGGQLGVVLSASYSEQDVTAFRPRVDRDNVGTRTIDGEEVDFLPIQFLVQDYDNFEFETKNYVATIEYAPNDNTKFYFDAVINDQERRQESSRVQASGVSALRDLVTPTEFETINFGSLGGTDLGSIEASLSGILDAELAPDGENPNLRFSSDTNSRLTESEVFRLGGEWQGDNLSASVELASSTSESTTPSFNTTLNFINPNSVNDSGRNENSVPFIFDLSGGTLQFGVAGPDESDFGVTAEELLDVNNVVLDAVSIGRDRVENKEDAFRTDFSYYLDTNFFTSVDFGYRYSKVSSVNEDISSSVGLTNLSDSPNGALFADLLVAGPDNFNDADGRELFVSDFLLIDPELVASDPDSVLETLQIAIDQIGGTQNIGDPTSSSDGFFEIEEKTHAVYLQANFEAGIVRGNFGVRYLQTDIDSTGFSTTVDEFENELVFQDTTTSDYDFVLPRVNIVADLSDDLILRFGYAQDIRRPDFDELSSSTTFKTGPNDAVEIGNPGLIPEEVESFDLSLEWYFAEASVLSIGAFYKTRSDLHVSLVEDAASDDDNLRDFTDPCEGGGVFNPIADRNVFVLPENAGTGLCVPAETFVNDSGETTQKGLEFALQYDLAGFEDDLGWASGFGILANYTIQEFSGGTAEDTASSRAADIFEITTGSTDTVTAVQGLLNLSENAYNFTLYYEKFGLSARMRYTWREAYRTDDFGSTSNFPLGFPAVQEDRGQLNASINYDVNDNLSVGIEAVNLTTSDVEQSCINEGALNCFQGLTDRRITFGVNYRL